ncbi:MAG TPA: hypothetical protein VM536_23360 [Chloroflexia bacterium]|nr:hypothetical protein [Chloroflexia bacterium]
MTVARLRRWAPALAVTLLASWLGAYLAGFTMPAVYIATATVQLEDGPAVAAPGDSVAQTSGLMQVGTYAQLVHSRPVLRGTLDRAGIVWPEDRLDSALVAVVVPGTTLLEVRVYDENPERGARLANAAAEALQADAEARRRQASHDTLASLEREVAEVTAQLAAAGRESPRGGAWLAWGDRLERLGLSLNSLQAAYAYYASLSALNLERPLLHLVEPAVAPHEAISTASIWTGVLVSGVALVAGLAVLAALEALDRSIHGPREVQRALGLPILGAIPGTRTRQR